MERIADIGDPRLEAYAGLTDLQLRCRLEPERGIFIAESEKVIGRALDAGYEPISLLAPEHRLERARAMVERFEELGADVFSAPASELEKLAGYEITRGVLAAMRRKPLPSACELLEGARRVAVVEDVTNHANVGSLFRNAAALGIDAVLVSPGCCDPLYRRAVRVSMGSVFKVPWTRVGGRGCGEGGASGRTGTGADGAGGTSGSWQDEVMAALRKSGFKSAAFALHDDSIALDDPALKECPRLALFFGTEGEGLAQRTIDACDYVVKIPMQNGVDSLNVAATSAIAFWELQWREGRADHQI